MYLPIASGVWSFCQEVEKKSSLHCLPASWCGPALVPIMNVPASVTVGATASMTFDQMMPGHEVDLVLLQHLVGELLADVGLDLVVAVDDLGVEAADLAAEVVERELDRVLHVLADDALRARQRGDEADLELLLGERRAPRGEQAAMSPTQQGT